MPVVASNGKYGSYLQGTCIRVLELASNLISAKKVGMRETKVQQIETAEERINSKGKQ